MGRKPDIKLTQEERRDLQEIAKSDNEPKKTRLRAIQILLSDFGESAINIGRVLGIAKRTVQETRERWRRHAFEGLYDLPKTGRPPKVTPQYERLLRKRVQTDPRRLGFAFSRWTCPRLAEYLYQETGIRITPNWVAELLHTYGFVWRKSKLTIRNLQDHKEKERARRGLNRLKKGVYSRLVISNCGLGTE